MSQKIPIYIPTFINSATYTPARVLPRLYFYNGQVGCETWYMADGSNASRPQTAFPYFDHYNVPSGSQFPTTNSRSLLFNNEAAVYGQVPDESLYTSYWEKYISFLYNPKTRVLNCQAIIPLADYFHMELNDIVNFRGNYWHLRAINDYSLKTGECNLQLVGPVIPDVFDIEAPAVSELSIEYLVIAGGGGGGGLNTAQGANQYPGGGGAGGFRTGSVTFSSSISLPVEVGVGGQTGSGAFAIRTGGSSSFNGLISLGGGAGGTGLGTTNGNGIAGGSGGGGSTTGLGAAGTSGQGYQGGDGFYSSPTSYNGGYGGGAGGDGLYGPGATKAWLDGNQYAGGGNGVKPAASGSLTSGSGGSNQKIGKDGIVIIRYAGTTPKASGGTITTSGSYTYHTFISGGTFSYP